MISFIRGDLAVVEEDMVVIDVGGVGYGIFMPFQSITRLPRIGHEVKLFTYLNVREDAMQLYGFLRKEELDVFKLLLGVNGIGPKAGLNILSLLSTDELRFAVASGDVKAISQAPGVGKKTAEKLIIQLKDKLSIADCLLTEDGHGEQVDSSGQGIQAEVVQALTALGYGSAESFQAVKKVEVGEKSIEDVLKEALKNMI